MILKKFIKAAAISVLALGLVACGNNAKKTTEKNEKLKVIATANPHGEILEKAKAILKEKYGIELDVSITDDYYIPNEAVSSSNADANFFQHVPFFDNEKKTNGYKIANVGGVHIEPFGLYSKTIKKVSDVKDGATVIVSNSVADNGRILAILNSAGLVKLPENANVLTTTIADIKNDTSNPKHLKFKEVKPELLATTYANGEGDLVAINGNYAISSGLNPSKDALILEKADAKNPYVNIIACQEGHENDKKIKALVEVLQSKEMKDFIKSKWSDGSVIPAE
ncbi:methionine ABC transporter substrate-binding protein [Bulleidia sp. zg-1006]|nr:methionine ABC transporter substrate-binding protein [Bulleidia sp. zg-1006]